MKFAKFVLSGVAATGLMAVVTAASLWASECAAARYTDGPHAKCWRP